MAAAIAAAIAAAVGAATGASNRSHRRNRHGWVAECLVESLRHGGVEGREHNAAKGASEVTDELLAEECGHGRRIVAEDAAAPGAKNKISRTVRCKAAEDAADALAEGFRGQLLAAQAVLEQDAQIGSCRSTKVDTK